ncbi:MAG: response regulator transcription factor [Chitinophagaceae bacterium]|nr:MAG: response regulator transcription factor [Chitinophagaceae bacterium]
MKILIADEFAIYRFVVKSYANKCWPNAEIVEANTLQSVISEVADTNFDLLILDMYLPGSSALEAFVEQAVGTSKVIMFSEYEVSSTRADRLQELGVSALLRKSANIKEVVESFQQTFATSKMMSA